MRKSDAQGDPIVVVEKKTHESCVRSFPHKPAEPDVRRLAQRPRRVRVG